MKLLDDDYILADGAGWFETAGYAVRIYTDNTGQVFVNVYRSGDEMGDDVASCTAEPMQAAA